MGLPLSGSQDGQLIEIVTPEFDFYIKGELKDTSRVKVTSEDLACYQMVCHQEAEIDIINVVHTRTNCLYEEAIPQFFEQTGYQVIIEAKKDKKITFDHDSLLIRQKVSPIGSGRLLTGVINFGNEVGLTELRILVEGKVYLRLMIEIYPIKLSYKSDYMRLREDVASEVYNLTFDFMRTTYLGATLTTSKKPSLTEFYSIFLGKSKELKKALDLIIYRPHHELRATEEIRNYRNSPYIGAKGMKYLNKHPHQVQRVGQQFVPIKYLHIQKQITTNVYENQLVKYMVQQVIYRLKSVENSYKTLRRAEDQKLKMQIREAAQELEEKLSNSFLKDVSRLERMQQFSIVMQMSPMYKQLYKCYLKLQMGLSIWAGLFNISNKNIAELYEYWCFIKLGALLKKKHELVQVSNNNYNTKGLYVTLKKGKESVMTFKHNVTGENFTLAYNRVERTPTVSQKPDNMLSLTKQMADMNYQYVIDAKYRLNYEQGENELLEVPEKDDINTMHRYRDAIVYKNMQQKYERSVFGAIILFPGSQSEVYKTTRFYESIQEVNIGGLPFLPSNTSLVEEHLEAIVESLGDEQDKGLSHIQEKDCLGAKAL